MAGLLALLWGLRALRGSEFRWEVLWSALSGVQPGWLTLSIVLCLITYLGRALRWRVMLKPIAPDARLWELVQATAIGFTAIVLFGRPGELVRPYLIARRTGVSFTSQVAAWFLERVYDLLMVLVIFGFALSQMQASQRTGFGPGITWVLNTGGWIAAILGFLCLLILFGFRWIGPIVEQRLLASLEFLPGRYHDRIRRFTAAFRSGFLSSASPGYIAELLAYTIGEWILIVSGMVLLFQAFPATRGFSLTDIIIFIGFVAFGSAVQIPGIGGGVQVAAGLVLTEFFDLSLETAAAFALLIWVSTYVAIVPFGLAAAFHQGIRWRKLRDLKEIEDNQ